MAKKSSLKKKNNRLIKVDFTDVKAGGNYIKKDGDYKVKVKEIEATTSSNDNPQLQWTFEVTEGKNKGATIRYYTSLTAASLWNLRNVLEAIGVETEDSINNLDLDQIIEDAEECIVTVEVETYEDADKEEKSKAVIKSFDSASESEESEEDSDEEEEDEDEKPKKSSKKSKAKDEDEEDDEEEDEANEEDDEEESEEDSDIDAEDIKDMDTDMLQAFIDENDLDVRLKKFPKLKEKQAAVKKAFLAAQEESEEDEDEDSLTEDQVMDMSTKELKELIKTHKLKVDLEDYSNTRKKRKAVLKALQDKDLISE